MATPPTFTVGQVLTAAQMNAVGLWRITTCTVTSSGGTAATASNGVITVGTGNTSVTISNAFSADYDRYVIQIAGTKSSVATATAHMTLTGIGGTTQFGSAVYMSAAAATVNGGNISATADCFIGWFGTVTSFLIVDGLDPNNTLGHSATTRGTAIDSTLSVTSHGGIWSTSTSTFTGFSISPSSGTITGGTIRIYGYRN